MKGKYLITTDAWFVAPDGQQYKAVWGQVEIVTDEFLGIKTNRMATNWFAKVGTNDNHLIIAGCQIHYACKTSVEPSLEPVKDWQLDASSYKEHNTPSRIYIAN
ncbi:hypothetical protein [Tenacibaculum sp. 190524A02b]|uniref:hypothetical protein n=1 Tax=Tenacibaculum vairaonense TaxID=3137860 RepID=UPI0031FB1D0F